MKNILIVAALVALVGCGSPYQRESFRGGYSDYQLGEDIYQISFQGNGFTNKQTVESMALRRAAELTLQKGGKYFMILNGGSDTASNLVNMPSYARTTGTITATGNTAYYTGNTYQNNNSFIVKKHSSKLVIKVFENQPEGGFAYDAGMVLRSVGFR